jgi:YD repeat-containing protein
MDSIVKSPTTLAILFGASAFPDADLPAYASFGRSVDRFKSYLLESLAVQPDNIFNMFDSDAWPGELGDSIEEWIKARKEACGVSDVFFFYVGHGVVDSGAFRMASRRTGRGYKVTNSSLSSKTLKDVLYRSASEANFYVVLDCCYAASAHQDFQDTPSKSPAILYTAAGARIEAIAKEDEPYTRFSEALFAALTQGIEGTDEHLSFRQLEGSVDDIYRQRHPNEFVKPQLGAPNAPLVNVLELPVFPNPGFEAAALHYEYFTRWIRRRGVPEGLGPLTSEEVKRRKVSTRILREGGRIRKVETVNSSGLLAANYYSNALLGGSPDGQDQECAWEFVYHENGSVAREEVRNAFGRLLYRCEYSVADETETSARYFLNLSDLVQPRAKSGAAFVRIFRNESGFDQRLEFYDGFEQKQPDNLGSYGRAMELNSTGLEIRTVELDRAGSPSVCIDGYAITEYTSNPLGNTTSQAYFDGTRHPTFHKDGYHKAVISWSPQGNWSSAEFFGTNENPVLVSGGWTSWNASYDEAGNQTKLEFFGLDRKPVTIREGYAGWDATYDEHGRIIGLRYFDPQGHPTFCREGFAQVAYGYDVSGPVNEYRYLDLDGTTPAADRDSISRLTLAFDQQGNITKQLNWGTDGKLTRNQEGIAGYEAKYDSSGNQTLLDYLNVDGNLGPNNSGIARTRNCYDNRRRITEESYFDASDAPVEISDGHHRITYDYDEVTGRVKTSYFDRDGAPAFLEGYWMAIAHNDDCGRILSREFRDSANQPCWSTKGFASEQRSYDSMSRQLRQRYFGIDHKPVVTSLGYAGWDGTYDDRGRCTRLVYLDQAGNPVVGRPIETTTYDEYGNYAVKFTDAAGKPNLNSDGIAERRVERDPRGNDKRTTYWDADGKPVKRNEGFAAWEATYDRFDNRVEQRFLDESDSPATQQNGRSRFTWTYDSRRRQTSETYWDLKGNILVIKPETYAGWNAIYDDRGNQIELSYFGADGKSLIDCQYGYARLASVYLNQQGAVRREWFRANGESLSNLTITYQSDGSRMETTPSALGGSVIRTFDRAGHEIECEYRRTDGTRELHLEGSLVFSRFEEHFDRYNRSVEKRFYDADNKLFQSVSRIYDPAGNQIETSETQYQSAQNRTTRTRALTNGKQVEICITDEEGKALADESGRSRWVESQDASSQRVKLEYFDVNGNPTLFQGNYSSEYEYDSLGCLNVAAYSFPLDQDSVLNKKFRFGPEGSAHVQFQSLNRAGDNEQHEAYLIEYAMRQGDQLYYLSKVTTAANPSVESRTRQLCREVRPDGSYVVAVFVVPSGAEVTSQGQHFCDMTMTRRGKLVEISVKLDFSMVPMPAYPVFIGDTWQMDVPMKLSNPFTGEIEDITLRYSYLLRDVFTTNDGHRLAQIEVQCPKTRVPLGLAAAYTISASGITLFEVDKGFLFASTVHSETLTSVGADEYLAEVNATIQYYDLKQQGSTTENLGH